jgi:hypothetical protein
MWCELTSDKIMQLGLGFWGSKTFLSGIEIGVFTELAKGPQDGESLRTASIFTRAAHGISSIFTRSARDFFEALVSLGNVAGQRQLTSRKILNGTGRN